MHCDMESQTSSLVSNERQLVVHLQLTSLSGEEYQVIVDLQEFDRLDEFETAVLEQLPTIGGNSTFGCELTFVRRDTGQLLRSPARYGTPLETVITSKLSFANAVIVQSTRARRGGTQKHSEYLSPVQGRCSALSNAKRQADWCL